MREEKSERIRMANEKRREQLKREQAENNANKQDEETDKDNSSDTDVVPH